MVSDFVEERETVKQHDPTIPQSAGGYLESCQA